MFARKTFTAAIVAVVLASAPAFAQFKPLKGDPKEINFGIISTESTSNLREAWEPFLKDMEKALRMKVKPFFASDYAGIIEAMRFMIEYEPTFEVQPTIEMLAARAEYGPENVRACMTSEWTFNERALVFIMLNPDSMEDWGLFMFNAGLDLPIAAGWLAVQPAE